MVKAIYPGSFDPITNGHLDIARRALALYDGLTILIARNPQKAGAFTIEERVELIAEAFDNDPRVTIDSFEGLLVDYARAIGANLVIRGLRAVADFEYEFQMANMNRHLYPRMETTFLMTGADFYVSSSLVRQVAGLGGNIDDLVPKGVAAALRAKSRV